MAIDDEVSQHLRLSRQYLASAARDAEEGNFAPARLTLLHALELSIKAALLARTGQPFETHNVHGPFAQHFRKEVGAAVVARINRLVQEYGKSRYVDWEPPDAPTMEGDVEFVRELVEEIVPRLVLPEKGGRRP